MVEKPGKPGKPEKALITVEGAKDIEVMFNPNEYSLSTEATVSGEGKNITFTKVGLNDFTVNLFFDTYEKGLDVRSKTNEITKLLIPNVKKKKNKRPPVCTFVWGKFTYTGVIKKVDQKFTMFLSDGIPVRAELTVTFKSKLTEQKHIKALGISDSREFRTVKPSDRLDLIAEEVLGDSRLWRVIAKNNNIHDVLSFPNEETIGTVLVIPDYYNMKGAR